MVTPNGEQALSKLIAEPDAFDLLITDNNMPRMSGIELVTRLRDTPFSGKIVVLSAHLSRDNRAAYSALGVDEMMAKPFDVHQLRSVIKQIVRDLQPTPSDQNGDRPKEFLTPPPLDPFRLSPRQVHKLLELGLSESDEVDDPAGSI